MLAVTGCHRPAATAVVGSRPAPADEQLAPTTPVDAFPATVERVVDGDTFIARRPSKGAAVRVRIIGVDAPESVKPGAPKECFGAESSVFLRSLIDGRRILAAYQRGGRTDRFGRDLWDVWLEDGTHVGGRLTDSGQAVARAVRPQVQYAAYLGGAQAAAMAAGRGLWGSCPHPAVLTGPGRRLSKAQ